MAAKTNAHDDCNHESTRAARGKCRRIQRRVEEFVSLSHLELEKIHGKGGVLVAGWRVESRETGPVIIEHVGYLDHHYPHKTGGWPVWVITSDARPEGTGHMVQSIRVVE